MYKMLVVARLVLINFSKCHYQPKYQKYDIETQYFDIIVALKWPAHGSKVKWSIELCNDNKNAPRSQVNET